MENVSLQPYSRSITVAKRQDLEPALDSAVEGAIAHAMLFPARGVLVRRYDHGSFTVELTEDVPFGTTIELDLRHKQEH